MYLTSKVDKNRGNLFKITLEELPFVPIEILTISNVPVGIKRGGHAHVVTHQLLLLVQGLIEINLITKNGPQTFVLKSPGENVYLEPLSWGEQTYLEPNSILQVLSSHEFNEEDYIYDLSELEKKWGL